MDEDHAEGAASLVQAKAGHAVGVIHLHDKKGVDDDSGLIINNQVVMNDENI